MITCSSVHPMIFHVPHFANPKHPTGPSLPFILLPLCSQPDRSMRSSLSHRCREKNCEICLMSRVAGTTSVLSPALCLSRLLLRMAQWSPEKWKINESVFQFEFHASKWIATEPCTMQSQFVHRSCAAASFRSEPVEMT